MNVCDNCETEIVDEREMYEIEPLGYVWCEDCMNTYLGGPTDDYEEDMMNDLSDLVQKL